ncbi:MAG TPA: RNA methyltransferase [Ignavibacteriaceae bacterium]|nr:RNA methyltransferase [Ignavibacteriaceae bacterium]
MKSFRTEKRVAKVERVLKARQGSLMVVIENVHDPHNVSAIFRTCDAVGIPCISLVYTKEQFPKIGRKSSASAFKWVVKEKYKSVKECYSELRSKEFKIYASALKEKSMSLYDIDFTNKIAVVLGNEHRGASVEAADLADETFMIPMYGMVQSLNVSVATAVILYEALRQRQRKGMYDLLNEAELEEKSESWLKK